MADVGATIVYRLSEAQRLAITSYTNALLVNSLLAVLYRLHAVNKTKNPVITLLTAVINFSLAVITRLAERGNLLSLC